MASETLSAEDSRRLLDLARACKAATRIVSLYPPSHPTIQTSLTRITDAGAHAVAQGPFTITVEPDTLTVTGLRLARPDTAVNELAALLHSHRVGALTLEGRLTGAAWHSFLMLLAQPPEEVRSEGGISAAWTAAGGGPLAIREIDYALVLREGSGGTPIVWDRVLQDFLQGDGRTPDSGAVASFMQIATDAGRLSDFLPQALTVATEQGVPLKRQQQQLAQLLQAVATHARAEQPEQFQAVLDNMAAALPSLAPDFVTAILSGRASAAADGVPAPPAGEVDLASALRPRLDDAAIARFVASTLARERGASGRLAEAFQALVPDKAAHERILGQAEALVAEGAVGDDPALPTLWQDAARLLTSYSDEDYISDTYASDLSKAREAAVELDRISDDPPDRIAAWVATVAEPEVDSLNHALIVDLISTEYRPEAWAEIIPLATDHLESVLPSGEFTRAQDVLDRLRHVAADESSSIAPHAAQALRGLASGTVGRLAVGFLRQATDRTATAATRFCQMLGPGLVGPLVETMVAESNVHTVRRLRETVIGFGPDARAQLDGLLGSAVPSVRRLAIELIRAVGGSGTLPNVAQLLEDADTLVQREAVRAVVETGTDEAFASLHAVLTGGAPELRDGITAALGLLRDPRAGRLFAYLLRRTDHRGRGEDRVLEFIRLIGNTGASAGEAIEALTDILRRGEWWAPRRTRRLRSAAAETLGASRAPAAVDALRQVASDGPRGARRIARAVLTATGR